MIHEICKAISDTDGIPYFVGGSVRDEILGLTPKDFDIEVFGLAPEHLKVILERFGTVSEVGESFGVMKLRTPQGQEIDFSLPRRENKTGKGHKGFLAKPDPTMGIVEAMARRDFTINCIYKHAITGEIIDLFDGRKDIEQKTLRHINAEHFKEDPLRVLRGMQFSSRFSLDRVDPDTVELCNYLMPEYNDLPVERVREEWVKWATKGVKPSYGLYFLTKTGWVRLYPELNAMINVPQSVKFHPEGNVWIHVCHVCDAMSSICNRQGVTGEDREVLMWAALTHDMGKPDTTKLVDGDWKSHGHAEAGVPIAEHFLKSIGVFDRVIQRVLPLNAEHMWPTWEPQSRRTVRRLKVRLGPATLDELLLLKEADNSGRPPKPAGKCVGHEAIVELAKQLPPTIEPIITGKHIIDAGVAPGKLVGEIKKRAFQAQLDEIFQDEASGLVWLQQEIGGKS